MIESANNPAPETAQRLSGSQLIIKLLERQGVTHIAGVPGGAKEII